MRLSVISTLIIFGLIFTQFPLLVSAQTESSPVDIDATVKISVCGDGIAEGREECDLIDYRGFSCFDFDYAKGFLLCDVGCVFDITNCYEKIIPPVPVAPESDANYERDEDGDNDEDDDDDETSTDEVVSNIYENLNEFAVYVNKKVYDRPGFLDPYDKDDNNIIDINEAVVAIEAWANKWKSFLAINILAEDKNASCDLNNDDKCDIVDFSILMYHIERT